MYIHKRPYSALFGFDLRFLINPLHTFPSSIALIHAFIFTFRKIDKDGV